MNDPITAARLLHFLAWPLVVALIAAGLLIYFAGLGSTTGDSGYLRTGLKLIVAGLILFVCLLLGLR
jgi:hypothetical protein